MGCLRASREDGHRQVLSAILVRQPGGAEQGDQRLEVFPREVAELPGVAVAERLASWPQEGEAGVGDADADDPAVVGRAVAARSGRAAPACRAGG